MPACMPTLVCVRETGIERQRWALRGIGTNMRRVRGKGTALQSRVAEGGRVRQERRMGLLLPHLFCADILGCLPLWQYACSGWSWLWDGHPQLGPQAHQTTNGSSHSGSPEWRCTSKTAACGGGAAPWLGVGTLESDRLCSILAPHPTSRRTVGSFLCHSVPWVPHRVILDPA